MATADEREAFRVDLTVNFMWGLLGEEFSDDILDIYLQSPRFGTEVSDYEHKILWALALGLVVFDELGRPRLDDDEYLELIMGRLAWRELIYCDGHGVWHLTEVGKACL